MIIHGIAPFELNTLKITTIFLKKQSLLVIA